MFYIKSFNIFISQSKLITCVNLMLSNVKNYYYLICIIKMHIKYTSEQLPVQCTYYKYGQLQFMYIIHMIYKSILLVPIIYEIRPT